MAIHPRTGGHLSEFMRVQPLGFEIWGNRGEQGEPENWGTAEQGREAGRNKPLGVQISGTGGELGNWGTGVQAGRNQLVGVQLREQGGTGEQRGKGRTGD